MQYGALRPAQDIRSCCSARIRDSVVADHSLLKNDPRIHYTLKSKHPALWTVY